MRSLPLFLLILPVAGLSLGGGTRREVVPTKYPAEPGTFTSTTAKPPHVSAGRPADDAPGYFVPDDAETGTWKVTDTINGKKVATGSVRLFKFDAAGRGARIGEIQAGTVVSLKGMRTVDKAVFYAIPWEGKIAWINGYFLERGGQPAQTAATAK